jgi:structural maintenance of chromosome 1
MCRSQFEEEQLKLTLRNTAEDEQWKVAELGDRKRTIQVEITDAQETHAKAAKILDQALEEIGLKVRRLFA